MIINEGGLYMNKVMLAGKLAKDVEVSVLESGKEVINITLAVNRSYKNADGIYDVDFIDCVLCDELSNNIKEYCKKGDLIGIRGRLETSIYQKDKVFHRTMDVVVEKLILLSSMKKEAD